MVEGLGEESSDESDDWDDDLTPQIMPAPTSERSAWESIHTPLIMLMLLVAVGGIAIKGYVEQPDSGGDADTEDLDSNLELHFVDSADDLPNCANHTRGYLYYVADDRSFQSCTDSGWYIAGLNGTQGDQGGQGLNGTQGDQGGQGQNGTAGDTPFFQSSNSTTCANGGTLVDIGYDSNGNGTLEPGEISMSVDICDAPDGVDGVDGIEGANGTAGLGGQNGTDGQDGLNGTDGINGLDGADGQNGQNGQSGQDGTNGTDGQDGQDGADGSDALAVTSAEPAGVNCANGGIKVEVGVDDNGDGTLQSSEVDHVQYVCDGGSTPNTMLTRILTLSLSQCSSGEAIVVEHGLDNGDGGGTSANGQLESGEIDFRTTYCINILIIQLSSVSFGDGSAVEGIQWLTVVGSRLYFTAEADDPPPLGNRGLELWAHESSNNSTWRVTDINPGSGDSQPSYITAMGSRLYFSAYDGATGTSATGFELWAHETTNDSTWRVTDINPGSGHSSPSDITVMGTRLYFQAYDGTNGYELWAHETTNGSTWLVADINSGLDGSYPNEITVMGNRLYFSAYGPSGSSGYELWAHETTNNSTWQVVEIRPGSGSSNPSALTPIGTRLYFSANDGSTSSELWAHETSNSTTWRVTDINPGSGYSLNVDRFGITGTRLYFSAWDGSSGYELWAHEITNGSTWRVADINSGSGGSTPVWLTTIGTKLYFSAKEGVGCGGGGGGPGGGCGFELMAHDTVNGSTWRVADINVGQEDSSPSWLTVIGPRLFFGAYDGTDDGLWGLIIESTPAY